MTKSKIKKKNNIQKEFQNLKKIKFLSNEFNRVFKKISFEKKLKNNFYNLFNKNFPFGFTKKNLINFEKFNNIAIIGMGGSILGAEAIYQFLKEKIKKKLYFFDDLNLDKINNFKKNNNKNKTLFIIISKSGNTLETISNFLYLKIIKKNSKNIIIISEKKNNFLFLLSKKFNLFFIPHKEFIGGRYSVLSEVGLLPAYMMNLSIAKLRENINKNILIKDKKFLKESTTQLANILINGKISNLIFINYVPKLEKFLFWLQQLVAESLGKKGKGFLPVISNTPKDHHSLLQLYLDGPKDKLFYIFTSKHEKTKKLKTKKYFGSLNFLDNKDLSSIKSAQEKALIKTLKKSNIPSREFKISSFSEETIGELFSYFMLEIIFLGKITKINPFNQPSVEDVKKYTKKFLN